MTDDTTTRFEDGFVHVQPVKFWAAIDEVVYSSCRTTYRYVIRSDADHGRIVSLGKLRQTVGRNRARNDDKAYIVQVLNGARRQLATRINFAEPVDYFSLFRLQAAALPTARTLAQCLRPTANRLADERTYITPSDKAGVAISISPIELVAM